MTLYIMSMVNPDTGKEHMKPHYEGDPRPSRWAQCGKRADWDIPGFTPVEGPAEALRKLLSYRDLACGTCLISLGASITWQERRDILEEAS